MQSLLSSIPVLQTGDDYHSDKIQAKSDEVPTLTEGQQGCSFSMRCPYSEPQCLEIVPQSKPMDEEEHGIACHVWGRILIEVG